MKSPITTHVLDTAQGQPAANIHVVLEVRQTQDSWETVGDGRTDTDGRINNFFIETESMSPGTYRLTFNVSPYFQSQGVDSFYSVIPIVFTLDDPNTHYHVPLLLSPYGYSTYRGS